MNVTIFNIALTFAYLIFVFIVGMSTCNYIIINVFIIIYCNEFLLCSMVKLLIISCTL